MGDEPKDDYDKPQRRDMPLISIPTETSRTYEVRPGEQPPSVTAARAPGTTDFVLGINTCGFTTSSAVTCEIGYECTNVGDYRGCCLPEAEDCASTIYTDCIDYREISSMEDCESQTLCCSETNPYCFTYWFNNDMARLATLTHIECRPSRGFGKLYPFPPELTMAPSDSDSAPLMVEPEEDASPHSLSTGAIVGVVVGPVAFVILVLIAAILIFRRRRARNRASLPPPVPAKGTDGSIDMSPTAEKSQAQALAAATSAQQKPSRISLLRSLSIVREHPNPKPNPRPATSPSSIRGSISSPIASTSSLSPTRLHVDPNPPTPTRTDAPRASFGPNWPLGPTSGTNPLASHPVDPDLKMRLSMAWGLAADGGSTTTTTPTAPSAAIIAKERVPALPFPPPPPPGTKPALPPRLSLRALDAAGDTTVMTPRSAVAVAGAELLSPRVAYVPVSPIEERVSRASRLFGGLGVEAEGRAGSAKAGVVGGAALGSSLDSALNGGGGEGTSAESSGVADREPVSPVESDGEGEDVEDVQRFSYVSAPSVAGEVNIERDELVSPVSVDEVGGDAEEGRDSPVTVSPLESPRESVEI